MHAKELEFDIKTLENPLCKHGYIVATKNPLCKPGYIVATKNPNANMDI